MKEFGLLILTGICLNVFFLVICILFPKKTEITQLAIDSMPGRSFLLGVVNTVFFGAITLAIIAIGEATGMQVISLIAVIFLVFYAILFAIGLSSMAKILGMRLAIEKPFYSQTLIGGTALILSCLTPFIGWFLLFPYLGMTGVGGLIIGFYRDNRLREDELEE